MPIEPEMPVIVGLHRFVFSLGSAVIVCSNKKQPTVALSSIEAEYRGAVVATLKARWLKRMLKDL